MPPNDTAYLLAKTLEAHLEAVKDNTRQLQEIGADMAQQTALMQQLLTKISSAETRVSAVEANLSGKLSDLLTSIKVQWVIISAGVIPVLYIVAKGLGS